MKTIATALALMVIVTPALANVKLWVSLPIIGGTYGSEQGCKAYLKQAKGDYIAFDPQGWGAGEAACDVKAVKHLENKYQLSSGMGPKWPCARLIRTTARDVRSSHSRSIYRIAISGHSS